MTESQEVRRDNGAQKQKNIVYLVLNGCDVSLIPPVQGTRGLQEVGLHEQRPLELSLRFELVAVHDLPELLVSLQENKVIRLEDKRQQVAVIL